MKNIVISSRGTDRIILLPISIGAAVVVPFLFNWLPNPTGSSIGTVLNSAISLGLGILAWTGFRLIEPNHVSQGWTLAKLVSIPAFWGLLFWGVTAWVHHVQAPYLDLMEKVHGLVVPCIA
jgi:hypothetical protein